jgi:hypothetical protein
MTAIEGDQVEGAVTGAIVGLTNAAITVLDRHRDKKWLKEVAAQLDEMLRNPKHPFRTTVVLGRVLGDRSESLETTRAILMRIPGVRGNLGEADTWINDNNWERDKLGRLQRTSEKHGILKPGLEPGKK